VKDGHAGVKSADFLLCFPVGFRYRLLFHDVF